MTNYPGNVLIVILCLLALVLASGFTQPLVPKDADVQFRIQGNSFDCGPDDIGRLCGGNAAATGDNWQVELLPPLLEDLIVVNESSTGASEPDASSAESESTAQSENSSGSQPPATDGPGGGPGLGAGFEWLLWPSLALLGGVVAIGAGLGIRKSSLKSPRDVLHLPGVALGTLLSLVVGLARTAAGWLRAQRAAIVQAIMGFSRPLTSSELDSIVGRLPTVAGLRSGLVGIAVKLLGRIQRADTDRSGPSGRAGSKPGRPPELLEGDIDIEGAWAWLAYRTADRQAGSNTPDDIAREAIDRGYPREAVRDLLAVFRDVTYGDFPPTDDRLETARDAYETLRAAERSMGGGDRP